MTFAPPTCDITPFQALRQWPLILCKNGATGQHVPLSQEQILHLPTGLENLHSSLILLYNNRTAWVGRNLKDLLVPTLLLWAGLLIGRLGCQGLHSNMALNASRNQPSTPSLGDLFPMPHHHLSKTFPPNIINIYLHKMLLSISFINPL